MMRVTEEQFNALFPPLKPGAKKPRAPSKRNPEHVSESSVVSACIKWLWANGCYVWRNNTGGFRPEGSKRVIRYGALGSPDIIGLTPNGRFIGIECKSPTGGSLSPPQERFRTHVLEKNGIYLVVRNVDKLKARKDEILS